MNNNVITTSQNIKGDISTCTLSTQEVNSGRTFWVQNKETILINNCTGSTTQFQNWEVSDFGFGVLILVGLFLFVIAAALVNSME